MAGNIRAGGAFVEMIADSSKFQQGLSQVHGMLSSFGQSLSGIGFSMTAIGASISAPLALMSRAFLKVADDINGKRIETVFGIKFENDKAGMSKVRSALSELGAVADKELVELASMTRDSLRIMGETVRVLMANVGAAVAPSVKTGAIAISAMARAVTELVSANPQVVQRLSTVGAVVGGLGAIFTAAGFGVIFLATVMGSLGSVLAVAKFAAIGAALTGLVVVVGGMGGAFTDAIAAAKEWFGTLITLISQGRFVDAIKMVMESVVAMGKSIGNSVISFFAGAATAIAEFVKVVADSGIPVLSHLFAFIGSVGGATAKFLHDTFAESINSIVNLIRKGQLSAAWKLATETIKHTWMSLVTEIKKIWIGMFPALIGSLGTFIEGVGAALVSLANKFNGIRRDAIKTVLAVEQANADAGQQNQKKSQKKIDAIRAEMKALDDQHKFTPEERKTALDESQRKTVGIKGRIDFVFTERQEALRKMRVLFEKLTQAQKEFQSSNAGEAGARARIDSLNRQIEELEHKSNPLAGMAKALADMAETGFAANTSAITEMDAELKRSKKSLEELRKESDKLGESDGFDIGKFFGGGFLETLRTLFDDALGVLKEARDTGGAQKSVKAVGTFSAFEASIIGGKSLDPLILEARRHTRLLEGIREKAGGPPRFK